MASDRRRQRHRKSVGDEPQSAIPASKPASSGESIYANADLVAAVESGEAVYHNTGALRDSSHLQASQNVVGRAAVVEAPKVTPCPAMPPRKPARGLIRIDAAIDGDGGEVFAEGTSQFDSTMVIVSHCALTIASLRETFAPLRQSMTYLSVIFITHLLASFDFLGIIFAKL